MEFAVVCAYILGPWEVEVGLEIHSRTFLTTHEVEVSLGCMRPCLNQLTCQLTCPKVETEVSKLKFF